MSLAIAWSYFQALRESDSSLARHFVVIAPDLTVFERLKDDFRPSRGGGIFLIATRSSPSPGAGTGISRWCCKTRRAARRPVGRFTSRIFTGSMNRRAAERRGGDFRLDGTGGVAEQGTGYGAALRGRIAEHRRVMVLNDEAHHLWDPGSAWNEAIAKVHESLGADGGMSAQLDFSATPKDNAGRFFQARRLRHAARRGGGCGNREDAGAGRGKRWADRPEQGCFGAISGADHAWLRAVEDVARGVEGEWKKPLLFVMTEDTDAANQIAQRLNTDPLYSDLNGRTMNLHTKLKGKSSGSVGRERAPGVRGE